MKKTEQRKELRILSIFYLILYIVLRYLYPYPDGISDSGSYIAAAIHGGYDGYRPYGYSHFLSILNSFSKSVTFVIFIQYSFNALATLFFIFTCKYIFNFKNKYIYYAFVVFSLISILTIYLTNSILSDSLFSSLTIVWVTCNIWFICSKQRIMWVILIFFKIVILYFLVSLRFTGFFYFLIEIITISVILLKREKMITIISIIIIGLIAVNVYKSQVENTKKITGIETFSAFAGWQSANNALHVLPYIEIDDNKIKNKPFYEFAMYVENADTLFITNGRTSADYMWNNELPLKRYLSYTMQKRKWPYLRTYTYLNKEIYARFSKYIMLNYPWQYFKHFLLPNSIGVFHPKGDQLYKRFNSKAISPELLKTFFRIKPTTEIYSRSNFVEKISTQMANFRLLLWIILLITFILFIVKKRWKNLNQNFILIYGFLLLFLLGYTAFHIYATPFEIRYAAPIHLIQIALLFINVDVMFIHNNSSLKEDIKLWFSME